MYLRQMTYKYIIREETVVSMTPECRFPLKQNLGFLYIGTAVSTLRNYGVKPPGILSAVNQDGMSAGITAPNPQAQVEVLTKAWEVAKINPENMAYIECHGTGTNLGDPIEIDAITNAFKKHTNKKQFCGIGSV